MRGPSSLDPATILSDIIALGHASGYRISTETRRGRDGYGTFEDRRDWRPCFPEADLIAGDLARAAAMGNGKAGYEFVRPSKVTELIDTLRDASARRNIIAVVVDTWSLSLRNFKEFAEKFDAEAFASSGVMVTWNERDAETMAKLPILKNVIDGHFRGRIARQEHRKEAVKTPEELREALIATFNSALERLVEAGRIAAVGPSDAAAQPLLHVAP